MGLGTQRSCSKIQMPGPHPRLSSEGPGVWVPLVKGTGWAATWSWFGAGLEPSEAFVGRVPLEKPVKHSRIFFFLSFLIPNTG